MTANVWKRFTGIVTAPATAAYAGPIFYSNFGGTLVTGTFAGWDNIYLGQAMDSSYITSLKVDKLEAGTFNAGTITLGSAGVIQSLGFVSGTLGTGWQIDGAGNAEFKSLVVRDGIFINGFAAPTLTTSTTFSTSTFSVTVTPTPGSDTYYTINGSDPAPGVLGATKITAATVRVISNTTLFKARAFSVGATSTNWTKISVMAAATYTYSPPPPDPTPPTPQTSIPTFNEGSGGAARTVTITLAGAACYAVVNDGTTKIGQGSVQALVPMSGDVVYWAQSPAKTPSEITQWNNPNSI